MIRLFRLLPWFIQRRIVFERDRYVCQYCGSIDNLHVDHIWPRSKGGQNDLNNLITACQSCNLSKGGKTIREWITSMQKHIESEGLNVNGIDQQEQHIIVLTNKHNGEVSENVLCISKDKFLAFVERAIDISSLSESTWTGGNNIFTRSEFKTFMSELETLGIVRWRNERYPAQGRIFARDGKSALIDMSRQLAELPDSEHERIVEEIKTKLAKTADDELLKDAIEIAMKENNISVSMLQRKLGIGYNRSSKIVDIMEQRGIVGAYDTKKMRRSVLSDNTQQNRLL